MSTRVSEPIIAWEKLPDDFPYLTILWTILTSHPRGSFNREPELAGCIQPSMLIGTNFGICATVDGNW